MDLYLLDWVNFLLRWAHVIVAIAWIGSSFYFVHLDQSLRRAHAQLPKLSTGDAWQVHGGGFYHMVKYSVAPPELPAEVTWFKWEAYATWLSGIAMLGVVYYLHADLYLIDQTVWDMPQWTAVAFSIGGLVVGWVIYDLMCKSPLGRDDYVLLAAFFAALVALAFGLTRVFSGRGAFLELGAIIGTAMVANVAMVIIPNQRKVVAALRAGETPDPKLGAAGKQRSLHNNYLTLPVLFLMLSTHYPLAFASRFNWVIAAFVLVIGGMVRHFYNTRHSGGGSPWWTWGVAGACMAAIIYLSALGPSGADATTAEAAPGPALVQLVAAPAFDDVEAIVASRCAMCHAHQPLWEGMAVPPKGVMLDTPEMIRLHRAEIGMQAVYSHAMPPGGNLTAITDEERRVLAAWIAGG